MSRFPTVRLCLPALPILLVIGFTLSCVTSAPGSSRPSSSGPITAEQIADISAPDLYEVLQQLRPLWLRSRGSVSIQDPGAGYAVVYLDQVRFGPLATLRQINLFSVKQVEFIGAGDATTRFGIGHVGGVIMVSTLP